MALIKNKEITMVAAISKALDIMKSDLEMPSDEIIQGVFGKIRGNTESKIAAIAAVNSAISLKRKNPSMLSREVIERIVKETKFNPEIT